MAAEIPPAQLKYYEEHASDNQQPNLIATIVLCLALPCMAVALRFLARWRTHAGFKADDWLIFLALLPCAGMSTTTGLGIRYGEGKHIIFVKYPEGFVKIYVGGVVVYSFTVIFVKLSILYLYHRIFPSRGLVIIASCIAALVVAYSAALIIFAFLQCIPLSTLWTGNPKGVCVDTQPAYVTLAVMNVLTDIMILCLPIRFVARLQMKPARKIQVFIAFGLGGIVTIFGIVRCYYVGKASSTDTTWTATPGAIWSQVEIAVGIISACLPVYRSLFSRRAKKSQASYPDYASKTPKNSRTIPLSDRTLAGGWSTVTTANGMEEDIEERPFVKLGDAEGVMADAEGVQNGKSHPTVRDMYDSK